MLTKETQDAILGIEAINKEQASRALDAILELQTRIEEYFGVSGRISHLTATNPILKIE